MRTLVLLGLLLLPLGASASFADVTAAHESRRAIEYLQRTGVLQGYADGLFRPAFPINRAEFLKVLVAAKGIEPPMPYFPCFLDVSDQWYAPYVCHAQAEGWVQGYPDGTFGPERQVSFVEALKMLVSVRGYPPAPAEEVTRRGLDPSVWFAPYLTTALLIDVVSYEQVWGAAAVPLQAPLNRGFVAQLLYRSILAEGGVTEPLEVSGCGAFPTQLEIKTYVDVLMPSQVKIYRQELRASAGTGSSPCLLSADANPFARVTPSFDPYFLQPYPAGQPANSWTATTPLSGGRVILRPGKTGGAFRQEVFLVDLFTASMRQLPSVFATLEGSQVSPDGRYILFVGVSGRTLEALNIGTGKAVVLDALSPPLTFLSSAKGGQDIEFLADVGALVRYTVYDATGSADEYTISDVRTVDIDASFGASQPSPSPAPAPTPAPEPFPSDAPSSPQDDPFWGSTGTSSTVFP